MQKDGRGTDSYPWRILKAVSKKLAYPIQVKELINDKQPIYKKIFLNAWCEIGQFIPLFFYLQMHLVLNVNG